MKRWRTGIAALALTFLIMGVTLAQTPESSPDTRIFDSAGEGMNTSLALSVTPTPTLRPSATPLPTRTPVPTLIASPIPFAGDELRFSGYDYAANTTFGPIELPAGRYYIILAIDGPGTVELQPVTGTCGESVLFDFKPDDRHETATGVNYYSQGCTALIRISNATDEGWGLSFNLRFLDPTKDPLLTPTAMTLEGRRYEFEGDTLPANPLLGPIEFPAGSYTIHVVTHGALTVSIRPVDGVCQAGTLFDFKEGEAEDVLITEFRSDGCTAMIAISNMTTAIWSLIFYPELDPTPMPGAVAGRSYKFDSDSYGTRGLIGPIELPEGSYRATLTTDGYVYASLDAVSGTCYGTLYHLPGDPAEGVTEALFQSSGCNAMISIINSTRVRWSLTIEPINPNVTATPILMATPNHERNNGSPTRVPDAPSDEASEARAIRRALNTPALRGRVGAVEFLNPDRIPELRNQFEGRGALISLSVSASQQAAYNVDSVLLMETVGTVVSSRNLDLQFLVVVGYDPAAGRFTSASVVQMSAILDYQAGRITRDQLLNRVTSIDNNNLPQV